MRSLRLKPWQPVPCWIHDIETTLAAGDDGIMGRYAAALLLKKMLALGISRFHPYPIAAIERAAADTAE
jgi:hypothetical protein